MKRDFQKIFDLIHSVPRKENMFSKAKKHKHFTFVLAGLEDLSLNIPMAKAAPEKDNRKTDAGVSYEDLILEIASAQSKQAFVQLFTYFAPRLKSFLMKSGLAPESAEEVVQETMLAVWRKAKTFDPAKASASTWIFTIARNKKIDLIRKGNRPEYDPLDPLLSINAEAEKQMDEMVQKQNARVLKEAVETLPAEQKELIEKAFYEEKTHQSIAEEMQLPLGTVKSRIRLGMERLRHSLSGREIKEMVG